MEENCKSFLDLSTEVVTNFIQNVIVVDDKAKYEMPSEVKPEKLSVPGRHGKQEEEKTSFEEEAILEANEGKLNAKEVIDSFAKKGIVCSVIKPTCDENPWDEIEEVFKRADALILDWELDDEGENSTEIIRKIISEDLNSGPRLRLIIIYTHENDLDKISLKIQNCISSNFDTILKNRKLPLKLYNKGCTLSLSHLRIAIYAKEGVSVKDLDRVVTYERLPEVIIREFAEITSGIISNVAIESLAVLRRNTPLILGKLGPEMDPPYLTHRAWSPNPDDAIDFAMSVICSEFYSILDNAEVGQKANIEAIQAWLKYKGYGKRVKLYNKGTNAEVSFEEFVKYLRDGVIDVPSEKISKKSFKSFTKNYCQEFPEQAGNLDDILERKANELNCKFTMVTCLQQQYSGNGSKPALTSGTILKELKSDKFWLCIQPKCDCVRIKKDKEDGKRNFFFLELSEIKDDDNFDLVLQDDEISSQDSKFVKVGINYKIYNSALFNFEANYNGRVVCSNKGNNEYHFVTSDGQKFKWISEIKGDYMQKIINTFAAETSRVGLDEFEWSRRLSINN